jgi:hypothetical protein
LTLSRGKGRSPGFRLRFPAAVQLQVCIAGMQLTSPYIVANGGRDGFLKIDIINLYNIAKIGEVHKEKKNITCYLMQITI